MKVKDLIKALQQCPQELDVTLYYDGDSRLNCDGAFLIENCERYDLNKDEYITNDVLVLCETNDVYNYQNAKWFFKSAGE